MLLSVSVANLLMTTLARYSYITKPLKYPQLFTNRRAKISISGIWSLGSVILLLYAFKYWKYPKFRSLCFPTYEIAWTTTVLLGHIPFIVLIALNLRILTIASRQRKQILAENKSQLEHNKNVTMLPKVLRTLRTVKTVLIIVLVFSSVTSGQAQWPKSWYTRVRKHASMSGMSSSTTSCTE